MREYNIDKWYDPISERWIVPYEVAPNPAEPKGENVLDEQRRAKVERIWSLLVSSCARN